MKALRLERSEALQGTEGRALTEQEMEGCRVSGDRGEGARGTLAGRRRKLGAA